MEAIKIPTNEEISQGVPSIVACGYRSIASTKTANLTFPAWLIRWSFGTSTCEWWRTKRDFLLLHRAAARTRTSGSSSKVVPLPKAALEKLSQRAPWRRMDEPDNHNIHNAPLEPGSSSLEEEEETRNNFHVSMKKSLLQMDTFLRDIHAQCCVDDGEEVDPILSSAWRDFCRPSHTTGLVDLSSSSSTKNLATRRQEGARLGQYFCSSDNAARLVQRTLDWVTTSPTVGGDIVFLEPSCGNGQVVFELLQQLDHPKREEWKKGRRICIVGCDVDPSAIQACRARDTTSSGRVEWILGDFLSSSPPSSCLLDKTTVVVVLGGPPYTTGPGHGANITRRLPQQFLDACLQVWKAVFVAFLLPARYQKTPLTIPTHWICETLELESSTFYWQGDIPVWQPSMLQCFYPK